MKRALILAAILALSAGAVAVAASQDYSPGRPRLPANANVCRNGEVLAPGGGCACPRGQVFESGRCHAIVARPGNTHICPLGSQLNEECEGTPGGLCMPTYQCGCPPGLIADNGHCVSPPVVPGPQCGHGQIVKNGHCVCLKPNCGIAASDK